MRKLCFATEKLTSQLKCHFGKSCGAEKKGGKKKKKFPPEEQGKKGEQGCAEKKGCRDVLYLFSCYCNDKEKIVFEGGKGRKGGGGCRKRRKRGTSWRFLLPPKNRGLLSWLQAKEHSECRKKKKQGLKLHLEAGMELFSSPGGGSLSEMLRKDEGSPSPMGRAKVERRRQAEKFYSIFSRIVRGGLSNLGEPKVTKIPTIAHGIKLVVAGKGSCQTSITSI